MNNISNKHSKQLDYNAISFQDNLADPPTWRSFLAIANFTGFCILIFLWFYWLSNARLIARDEGFYVMAARLILDGQVLYRDFFFPQGPILPYIYAVAFYFFDTSWEVARFVCALLSAGTCVVAGLTARKVAELSAAFITILLLASCNIFWAWHATAQAYAVTSFLICLCFYFVATNHASTSNYKLFFIGLILCLAVFTRLYVGIFIPIFVLYFLFFSPRKSIDISGTFFFILGCLTPLIISLVIWQKELDVLWFNLVGYHLNRADGGTFSSWSAKIDLLQGLFGVRTAQAFTKSQYNILVLISLLALVLPGKKKLLSLIALSALAIFIVSLIPNPTYLQYFGLTAPLLAVLAGVGLSHILQITSKYKISVFSFSSILFVILLSFYTRGLKEDISRYNNTGVGVIGINNEIGAKTWNLKSLKQVQLALDQHIEHDDMVISFWPGYLLESKAKIYPGFENHFALRAARNVKPELRDRYKVFRWDNLVEKIKVNSPAAIITKRGFFPPHFKAFIAEQGYSRVWEKNQIIILKKQDNVEKS